MELSYIKKIIRLVENSDVDEIEIEEEGKKIRVVKSRNQSNAAYQIPRILPPQYPPMPPVAAGVSAQNPAAQAEAAKQKPESKFHEIRSPIVGTFYSAPSPDAEPYVEVGQEVKPGDVLCIVEAMKLMNEIESDVAGKITKIIAENAKPVEYNQVLFLIEPS